MKVLFIFDEDDRFGAAKAGMELVAELKQNGVNVVVCTSKRNRINEECNELGIENYNLGYHKYTYTCTSSIINNVFKWFPRFLRYKIGNYVALVKLKKYIDIKSIKLIHANTSGLDFGIYISKIYNIPNILHLREFGAGEKTFPVYSYRYKYIEYLNENVTRFIAISKTVKEFWVNKGIDKRKISVIYDGMNLNNIKYKREFKKTKQLKAIMLGSISKGKGHFEFINSISKIKNEIDGLVKIDIIGNGYWEDEKKLAELIKENKLEKIITVKKYDENIRDKLCEYDFGINCSNAEGLGRVTIEYLAAGLLVLASNKGANVEIIEDNVSGVIYIKEELNDFNNKFKKIITNQDFFEKILQNSTKELNRFDLINNTKEMIEIYKEIL